jgi:hypothetical protein
VVEIGGDQWERHRWQLVHVSVDEETLVVDALELVDAEHGRPAALVTLAFRSPEDLAASDDDSVGERLAAWVHRDDGLCDAYHRADVPYGCLAIFQRRDAVIVATDESAGTWWDG